MFLCSYVLILSETERPKQPVTGPKEYYKAPFLDPYTESPSFPQKDVKPAPGDYQRTPSDERFHEGDDVPPGEQPPDDEAQVRHPRRVM